MAVSHRPGFLRFSLLSFLFLIAISGCTGQPAEPESQPRPTDQTHSDRPPGNGDEMISSAADSNATAPVPTVQAGIGAALRIEDGKVFVSQVLPDTPAAQSNLLKPNDQIVAVAEGNEQPIDVTGTTKVARAVGMIRGPIGTVVRLTIVPEGNVAAANNRLDVSAVVESLLESSNE